MKTILTRILQKPLVVIDPGTFVRLLRVVHLLNLRRTWVQWYCIVFYINEPVYFYTDRMNQLNDLQKMKINCRILIWLIKNNFKLNYNKTMKNWGTNN